MKVLVTGGAGFIGSHLVKRLLSEHAEVHVIDNLHTGQKERIPRAASLHLISISDEDSMKLIETISPDVIFHLAAQTDVQTSIQDPRYDSDVNITGTINILNACKKSNVKKLIFASTSAVYGHLNKEKISEDDPTSPCSFYALSKHTAEQYIILYHKLFGVSYTILRFSNVYGPGQTTTGEGGVIDVFWNRVMRMEPVMVYGDGHQTRDFIYVEDVVSANIAAINHGNGQVFNVSTGHATSLRTILNLFIEHYGNCFGIKYSESKPGDIKHSCLDNKKAIQILSWLPQYDLRSGLEKIYRDDTIKDQIHDQ